MALMRMPTNVGGGVNFAVSNMCKWPANAVPSWNTPFKAKRVMITASGYASNTLLYQDYINFNPTTGEVSTSQIWVKKQNAPNTWESSTAFHFTITDTSVALSRTISGIATFYGNFIITDGDFDLTALTTPVAT